MKSRYAIPLIVLAVAIVYIVIANVEEESKEVLDPYLILFVGLTFTACMVITLGFTRLWTLRSAGVLLTLAGDGVLYTSSGFRQVFGNHWIPTDIAVDLTRACFYLGAPLLLAGLCHWIWKYRNPPPEPLDTVVPTGLP